MADNNSVADENIQLTTMTRAQMRDFMREHNIKGLSKTTAEMRLAILEHQEAKRKPSVLAPHDANQEPPATDDDLAKKEKEADATPAPEDAAEEGEKENSMGFVDEGQPVSKPTGTRRQGTRSGGRTSSEASDGTMADSKAEAASAVPESAKPERRSSRRTASSSSKDADTAEHQESDMKDVEVAAAEPEDAKDEPAPMLYPTLSEADSIEAILAAPAGRRTRAKKLAVPVEVLEKAAEKTLDDIVDQAVTDQALDDNCDDIQVQDAPEVNDIAPAAEPASSAAASNAPQQSITSSTSSSPTRVCSPSPERISVSTFLEEKNFAILAPIFEKEDLNEWAVVRELSVDTLRGLGVTAGTAIRFCLAVKELFASDAGGPAAAPLPGHVNISVSVDNVYSLMEELGNLSLSGMPLDRKPSPPSASFPARRFGSQLPQRQPATKIAEGGGPVRKRVALAPGIRVAAPPSMASAVKDLADAGSKPLSATPRRVPITATPKRMSFAMGPSVASIVPVPPANARVISRAGMNRLRPTATTTTSNTPATATATAPSIATAATSDVAKPKPSTTVKVSVLASKPSRGVDTSKPQPAKKAGVNFAQEADGRKASVGTFAATPAKPIARTARTVGTRAGTRSAAAAAAAAATKGE